MGGRRVEYELYISFQRRRNHQGKLHYGGDTSTEARADLHKRTEEKTGGRRMKVAIYCRLSEEDRDKTSLDSGSIENQKNMLCQYAKENHWEIYDIYSDDDYAGADRSRPEFCRLLAKAEERKFDIVLCKTQSRFTRELELVEKYIHGLFPIWGIRFVSIVDHGDTENKGNKKARQINGLINEWYLEDMSENIRSVLTNRRKRGLHIGSFALYGYEKDPDAKGHLRIDPEAAVVVREVFSLYSQGMGKTAIARYLNERGIPNPSEYKRQKGLRYAQAKGKTGTLWKYPTISTMLSNEIYLGHMVQGRYGSVSYKTKECRPRPPETWMKVKNTHEGIIEPDLWEMVEKRRESKAKPFTNGQIGLFAGKAKCLSCGYTLRSCKNRGKHYLRCSNRYVSKDACEGSFIAVERLAEMVSGDLTELAEQYLDEEILSRNFPLQEKQENMLLLQQKNLEKKLAEAKDCLTQLYRDRVSGILSEREFLLLSGEFQVEKETFEKNLWEVEEALLCLEQNGQEEDNVVTIAQNRVKSNDLTRLMVEVFVDCVFVGKRIQGTGEVPVEIHWNF